jgi:hypothetical protein
VRCHDFLQKNIYRRGKIQAQSIKHLFGFPLQPQFHGYMRRLRRHGLIVMG